MQILGLPYLEVRPPGTVIVGRPFSSWEGATLSQGKESGA